MIANICKYQFADNWHQATKYLQDIAGGIVASAPSSKDLFNPEIGGMVDKYLAGGGRFHGRQAPHDQARERHRLFL